MADSSQFFELLAVRVAAGQKVRDAAPDVGCSETTAYRLNREPEFKQRVAQLRTEATAATVGKLSDAATKAVDKMVELLDTGDPSVQLQAAKAILANVLTMSEQLELRQRLDEIESKSSLRAVS